MKTTIAILALAILALTILGASAAPYPQQENTPNPYPVSISNISFKHLIKSDTFDFTFHAANRSSTGEAIESVYCHTAWNKNGPYPDESNKAECAYIYSFWFPNGAEDTESYDIAVSGEGVEASTLIEAGPKYQCGPYEGEIGNVDTECKTVNGGEFYLKA